MADNPKSLASLADELEPMTKKPQYYRARQPSSWQQPPRFEPQRRASSWT